MYFSVCLSCPIRKGKGIKRVRGGQFLFSFLGFHKKGLQIFNFE